MASATGDLNDRFASRATSASSWSAAATAVDQPVRLMSVDEITGEQHLHRLLAAHVAREADARRGAEQPVDALHAESVAWSGATARSHSETSWHPAAVAIPCTRAITGWGSRVKDIIILAHWAEQRLLEFLGRIGAHLLQSCPAQKALPLGASLRPSNPWVTRASREHVGGRAHRVHGRARAARPRGQRTQRSHMAHARRVARPGAGHGHPARVSGYWCLRALVLRPSWPACSRLAWVRSAILRRACRCACCSWLALEP